MSSSTGYSEVAGPHRLGEPEFVDGATAAGAATGGTTNLPAARGAPVTGAKQRAAGSVGDIVRAVVVVMVLLKLLLFGL